MKTLIAQALVTQCFSIFFVSLSPIITLKRRQPPPSAVSDMTMATGANSNNKI